MSRIEASSVINNGKLQEAIIRTVAFFDLFEFPLTKFEIWKYLWSPDGAPVGLFEIETMIGELISSRKIEEKFGFCFLPGRDSTVAVRQTSYNLAQKKIKIAVRAAHWLKYFVGVKMVAVVNSVVLGSVKKSSDIDLFIVTARNRIWLSRLVVTALVEMLGLRRHGDKITDRLCLSFYADEDRLEMENLLLPVDPYFCYWLATLTPIYDDGRYGPLLEKNRWLGRYLPNYFAGAVGDRYRVLDSWPARLTKFLDGLWFNSIIGRWCERGAKKMQLKKMSLNRESLAGRNDSRVVISDRILKFHESDRRQEFLDRWQEKCGQLLA